MRDGQHNGNFRLHHMSFHSVLSYIPLIWGTFTPTFPCKPPPKRVLCWAEKRCERLLPRRQLLAHCFSAQHSRLFRISPQALTCNTLFRDPLLFPNFIHTQKRNPATHLKVHVIQNCCKNSVIIIIASKLCGFVDVYPWFCFVPQVSRSFNLPYLPSYVTLARFSCC